MPHSRQVADYREKWRPGSADGGHGRESAMKVNHASFLESLLAELRPACLEWIAGIHEPNHPGSGRYRYCRSMMRPYGVESTAQGVFILWNLEVLQDFPEKPALLDYLLGCQEPASGLFKDILLTEDDRGCNKQHSWEHIWQHHTGVVTQALQLCGVQPRYPLPVEAHADLDAVDPAVFTRSLDWQRPYLVSEHWMNAVNACRRKHRLPPGSMDHPALRQAFATLEAECLNPVSGFPDLVQQQGPGAGLGGVFKLMWAYLPCGRRYPYAEQAVLSILAMQTATGDFTNDGNMCLNWDAVWTLRHLTDDLQQTTHATAIRAATARLARRLLSAHRKPDGGFSFFPTFCLPNHNSIRVYPWQDGAPGLRESDVLGTMMCLEVLRINAAWQAGAAASSFSDVYLRE